jgi:hypothetical protein
VLPCAPMLDALLYLDRDSTLNLAPHRASS